MQRVVGEIIIEGLEATAKRGLPALDLLLRLLLSADTYGCTVLRDYLLHRVAALYDELTTESCPEESSSLFEAFLAEVAPQVCKDRAEMLYVVVVVEG